MTFLTRIGHRCPRPIHARRSCQTRNPSNRPRISRYLRQRLSGHNSIQLMR